MSSAPRALAATVAVAAALAGCGGGGSGQQYTTQSIRAGLVKPADLGKGAIELRDTGHASHVIYTPPESVPTCPYVQRADDTTGLIEAAVVLDAGSPTRRIIVSPPNPERSQLPVVEQGAVVFANDALATTGMQRVTAAAGKCPKAFTVLGGPPVVVGSYAVNTRPIEIDGWKGFAQQLAHQSPKDFGVDTYDDLMTIVLRKANAIVYAGFAQIKKVGEPADSSAKAETTLRRTLARLD
ncbi:MAG TPA: hypothetical protein VNS09_25875 [Solirubrobacter sp.]|nr:hypothetical protein [Solirubrobacter sp.]